MKNKFSEKPADQKGNSY